MTSFTVKTEQGLPTTQVVVPSDVDYVTVVGAKTITTPKTLKSQGNDYMFINQGLLDIRLNPKTTTDEKIISTIIVIKYGYTDNDIERIQKYASAMKAKYIFVNSVEGVVNWLNLRKKKNRMVKKLTFFCHGVPKFLCLRYGAMISKESGDFGTSHVMQVDKNIFHYDAEVISYACRTGVGATSDAFNNIAEAKPEESLAQFMANHWMLKVRAFQTRSLYSGTYGESKDATQLAEVQAMEQQYEDDLNAYKEGRLKEKPYPPIGMLTMEEKKQSIQIRDQNDKFYTSPFAPSGPIMPLGAWNLPTSAPTPTGVKKGLQVYEYKP